MTTDNAMRVLLIGKSQLVLDESVAGLRDLGYRAEATNDSTDITGRFDVKEIGWSSSADKSPRTARLS
jgi:hypothetical protein